MIAFVVALGIVAAIFWFTRERSTGGGTDERGAPAASAGPASSTTPASAAPAAPGPPATADPVATVTTPVDRVRRLDPEARRRLAAQIAAARAREADPAAEAPVALVLEDVAAPLQERLRETIPFLAGCYDDAGALAATANLRLVTDPELGTVIDSDAITDADGQPLPPTLDTCLREVIDSLALPPLGPRGGTLPLQYTFRAE